MGYKTTLTRISSAKSTKSRQTTSYQYPSGNGVVLAGSTINSQTTAYLDITVPGQARAFTAVSGGAGTTTIISNLQYLNANNIVTNAIAVSTTGGNILINGNGFANTSRVYVNNQLVTNTFVNSNAIIATLSANSVGNVSLAIFNSSGQSGVFSNSNVRFSGAPSWVSSGAISSYNDIASNVALEASGDGTLTYSLQSGSGSLPSGISLVSTGYLSGTATGYTTDTVVTFTLVVTDAEGQAAQQNYSYTVFIGDTYFKQTSLLLSADTANTFISDSSTNNFLVSRFGDTRPSRFSPYWPGGWSGYFDGTGDYLTVASNTAFQIGTGNYTFETWVYKQTSSRVMIMAIASAGLSIAINTSGNIEVCRALTAIDFTFTANISNNVWVHIAVSRSGTSLTAFLNGVSLGTQTSSTTYGQGVCYIGIDADATGTPFNGYLSNLRLLKGTALYTANFTPSTTALTTVANTSILTLRDSVLADRSPNNFTITRNGDTKLTTFSPFNTAPYTFTANSNSVYFDGTGDYLSIPSNAAFNFGTGDFTIECWVYYIAYPSDNFIVSATGSGGMFFGFRNSASPNGFGYGRNAVAWDYVSGVLPNANQWNHLAITRSGTSIRMFLNGSQIGVTQTSSQAYDLATTTLTIGSQGATYYYNGYISNLRILKGTALYTANFTPATTALTSIANTSLLTCQSTTVIDNSSNNFTITVNGNPNVSIVNPFGETVSTISNYTWSANSYSASAYFDGTGDYLTVASNASLAMGTGSFTWEAWIYWTGSSGTYRQIFSTRPTNGSSTTAGSLALQTNTNYLVWYTNTFIITTSTAVVSNTWAHVAIVRNGTAMALYINGIIAGTATNSDNLTASVFSIGANNDGSEPFAGYISNSRILKGTALYTGPFVPPAAPLTTVANTSILTLQTDIGSNSSQFVDQSAQNNLITRNGNASQGAYSPLVPSSWSAYFDGNGDYLSAGSSSAFAFGTGAYTVEGWVYITSSAAADRNLFCNDTTNGFDLYFNYTNSTTRLELRGGANIIAFSGVPSVNQWVHVALVRNSTSSNDTKLYFNGVLQGTGTDATNWTITGPMLIGGIVGAAYFLGYISNTRILKGTALYTANFTPATTTISPIANTSLLTLREPILADNSGNNFTITRNGDTKIVPFGPFSPQTVTPDSYSYRFSNASDYISTTNSNLALGTNDWTVESWVYPRFTANSGIFQISNVQYGLTNSNLNTVALGFSSGNKAIVRVANASYTSTGTSITANAWTHLALVKSSNVSKLYINGTLDSTIGTSGSITDTVNYTGTTNIAVGGYGSTSALANAYISNFRVVSNSAVYISNFTVNTGPISAISGTTLLTCQANTIVDGSSANLTITANANVTPSKFNPFDETVTVGQSYSGTSAGGSAYFDGTGDSVQAPAGSAFAYGTGDFTIEGWFYASGSSLPVAGSTIYAQTVSGTNYLWIVIESNNKITAYYATSGAGTGPSSANTWNYNSWNHFAFVRSGNTAKIYLNGITSTGVSCTQDFNNTTYNPSIGAYSHGENRLTGYVSNLRVLKGTALYTSNFVPPAAPALPTTANTSLLLNFTNSGVVDSTGRNILETVNDARVVTSTYKYGSGSYYFDGSGDYLYSPSSQEFNFGTGDFTIELWVNPINQGGHGSSNNDCLIDFRPGANGVYGTLYIFNNGTGIYWHVNSANRITGGVISNSVWTHIAVCRSNSNTKLFINGTQSGSTYADTNNYLVCPMMIGQFNDGVGAGNLNGYLDDIRITKGYARYTANFTAPTAPFVNK